MTDVLSGALAEVVAALFTWGLPFIVAGTALSVAYWVGWRNGQFAQARAEVQAAIDRAVAETIPRQRDGEQ